MARPLIDLDAPHLGKKSAQHGAAEQQFTVEQTLAVLSSKWKVR